MSRSSNGWRVVALSLVVMLAACQDTRAPMDPAGDVQMNRSAQAQDLRAWFAQASPEVMALPQTVFAGVDEQAGALVFGVENAGVARGISQIMARRGVPAAAYRVRVTEPIHFAATLRDEIRPVMSGLQIHWGGFVCTLGFSVDHAGGRSFITNSHCTDKQGTTGNTQYNQPSRSVSPDPIGFEADDPRYTRGGGCSAGKVCRYSDAARALYEPGIASQARIARTTGMNSGSLTIDGHFGITSQNNTATSFSGTVHKVGRTTGWTSGTVGQTCATVNVSGSNIQLRCQTLVQSSGPQIVAGGDSGSPVFTVSGSNAELVGILWGGNSSGTLFVFSPFKNIQDELGSMNATTDGVGGGSTEPPPDPEDPPDDEEPNCPPGHARRGLC